MFRFLRDTRSGCRRGGIGIFCQAMPTTMSSKERSHLGRPAPFGLELRLFAAAFFCKKSGGACE